MTLEESREIIPLMESLSLIHIFTGEYLTVSSVEQVIRRSAATAGLSGVTPHCRRHSFATHLMEQGVERQNIQALLGQDVYKRQPLWHYLRDSILLCTVSFPQQPPAKLVYMSLTISYIYVIVAVYLYHGIVILSKLFPDIFLYCIAVSYTHLAYSYLFYYKQKLLLTA